MISIISEIAKMRRISGKNRAEGRKIGFVPTMGALHEGHLSLVKHAVENSDFVMASIFVNPAQFGTGEDFKKYPRDLDSDARLIEAAGGDLIFAPRSTDMYPEGFSTYVSVERLTENLCGKTRPTHFRGVTTVVAKLFNIVNPHVAFFGQKDAQQLAVVKRMVRDLDIPVEIIGCPIVREPDGLAMSSRNEYLSTDERGQASILYSSLLRARELVDSGVVDSGEIVSEVRNVLEGVGLLKIDYIEIVDPDDMTSVDDVSGGALLALAGWLGTTRLIDNIMLFEKKR